LRTREELLAWLRGAHAWNGVLVVGGGVNGVGVFRDLALQGVPSLLVEQADFCSGTSSAPSRLIHGGLRYLETGEFALVRESVVERNHMLGNAPHLVRPIPVWVPAFSWTGGALSAALRFLRLKRAPGPKGAAVVKLGLAFFDRFGNVRRSMPRHRMVARREALAALPGLSDKVAAVLEYYDARISSPERLVLEIVADAERDCAEARAIPYLAVRDSREGRVRLVDSLSGEEFFVTPRLVVNCAGPWLDLVDADLDIPKKLTGGTKGSHIVLARPDLAGPLGERMLYFETHDHRACLIYALDAEHVLLGTTDLRTDRPDDVVCSDAEIDYLFKVLEEVWPGADARREQIVLTYAGVRPLPLAEGGATGAISRDHYLRTFEPEGRRRYPVLALVGGKWTTYRACAEQVADAVLGRLGLRRIRSTLEEPIGGGRDYPTGEAQRRDTVAALADAGGVPGAVAERLLRRYGTAAFALAGTLDAEGRRPLGHAPAYLVGEIRHIAREERVTRLEDVVLRRTLMAFEGLARPAAIEEVGRIVAETLGWSGERVAREVSRTLSLLRTRYRMDLGQDASRERPVPALG